MRTIAVIANFGLIGAVCYLFAEHGPPTGRALFIALFIIVAPILNVIALFSARDGKGWLALYLKRKTLEEQRKIADLKRNGAA